MQPEFSIIVPVYNVEKYLHLCVDSLRSQTFAQIEIILVDDGSTDRSPEICDEYSQADSRITTIHQINSGAGLARNAGLNIAKGKYITFVDSDDYLDADSFERLLGIMETENLDLLRFGRSTFISENKLTGTCENDDLKIYTDPDDIRRIQLSLFSRPTNPSEKDINLGGAPWGAIFKREIINRNNIRFLSEREIISEDYIFNYEYLNHCKRVGKTYRTLYHWRLTPNSITRSPKTDNVVRTVATAKLMTQKFRDDKFPPSAENYAMGYVVEVLRAHIKNILVSKMSIADKMDWLRRQADIPYISHIHQNYPWRKLKFKHQFYFYSFARKHFRLLYAFVAGQEKLRALKSKLK